MGFTQAIASGFSKYVTFSGRAARSEFWYWVLFTVLASVILSVVDGMVFGMGQDSVGVLGGLFSLGTILPSIAMAVRRLHDTDRSGWWYLLIFVPIIGWIILIIWYATAGQSGSNRFGADPLGESLDDSDDDGFMSSSVPPVKRD
jgi:uncharacterized membrane protein YhaH (DUF805 family)